MSNQNEKNNIQNRQNDQKPANNKLDNCKNRQEQNKKNNQFNNQKQQNF